jgi:multidrug resistance efflux pump
MTQNQQTSMYRLAAIDAHYMHKYGKVCMLPNIGHFGLFVSIAMLVTLALGYISTQPFFDTVNVAGWVSTTTASIEVRSQEAAGIVDLVFVANGTAISAGQPIATISRSQGEVLGKKGIDTKRIHILQTQANHLAILEQNTEGLLVEAQRLIDRHLQSTKQIEELILHQQAHKNQLSISKQRWLSVKKLAQKGTLTAPQLEQSELQMLTLHQQDFELFMKLQSLQTSQANIGEQIFKNKQQQSQMQHERNLLNIQAQQDLDSLLSDTQYTVNAPSAGIVDNLQIETGKSVSFNQVLTQIAPLKSSFYIQLAIPSHQVAFLQKNQQVRIKVDGFAYQKYGSLLGIVTHISEQVISPSDVDGMSTGSNLPVYLVNVDIEYKQANSTIDDIALRSGMTVSASINKQESTILEWLLAPLLEAILPKFTSQEGQ